VCRATLRHTHRFHENAQKIVAFGLQHDGLAIEDGVHGLFRQALFPFQVGRKAAAGLQQGTCRQQDYGRNGQ